MESALSHPLRDEDIDFKLLEAQLHIAQAAQVLREQDRGHGLSIGVTRGASLASASDHEGSDVDTPALSHDAFTPSTDSVSVFSVLQLMKDSYIFRMLQPQPHGMESRLHIQGAL